MNEFLELSQGNLSIEEYHQDFAKLIRYAPNGMVEERILNSFVRKFNPPLDRLVKNSKPESISQRLWLWLKTLRLLFHLAKGTPASSPSKPL